MLAICLTAELSHKVSSVAALIDIHIIKEIGWRRHT